MLLSNSSDPGEVRTRAGRTLVAVFGNSAPLPGDAAYEFARAVGSALASAGLGVVNGGYGGTMAASARGAVEAGGYAVGVTIAGSKWRANEYLSEEIPAPDHLQRLLMLADLGAAYVVLPGGTGTLLELAHVWESINKGWSERKPLVMVGDGWRAVADTIVREQPKAGTSVAFAQTAEDVVEALSALR